QRTESLSHGPISGRRAVRLANAEAALLNGIRKAAARDLGPHLVSHLLVSMKFLGLLADVDLHFADIRRTALVLISRRFALNRVHRSLNFRDLSVDGGKGWSRGGIYCRAVRPLRGACNAHGQDGGT